jgi:hypothetical protein
MIKRFSILIILFFILESCSEIKTNKPETQDDDIANAFSEAIPYNSREQVYKLIFTPCNGEFRQYGTSNSVNEEDAKFLFYKSLMLRNYDDEEEYMNIFIPEKKFDIFSSVKRGMGNELYLDEISIEHIMYYTDKRNDDIDCEDFFKSDVGYQNFVDEIFNHFGGNPMGHIPDFRYSAMIDSLKKYSSSSDRLRLQSHAGGGNNEYIVIDGLTVAITHNALWLYLDDKNVK